MLPAEEACMVPSRENGDQQWVARQDSISCCTVKTKSYHDLWGKMESCGIEATLKGRRK